MCNFLYFFVKEKKMEYLKVQLGIKCRLLLYFFLLLVFSSIRSMIFVSKKFDEWKTSCFISWQDINEYSL